ncbi:unnamed protein product [Paramecium sonneborni]|uniref:cDENN domain-containing protein n=1 Tax=Paramecium sonneborni TaxID=65129 RepID=A0A8S1RL62_9CILI|nr:unnamed protein product [Paramecium sonneborni]
MKNPQIEIQTLKNENQMLQQQLIKAQQEISIYKNNLQLYDQERQKLLDERDKLEERLQDNKSNFEKKVKRIIERMPCQIDKQSRSYISNSIIQKAKGVMVDLVIAYKDAYKEDYRDSQRCKCQSLFESFYIIGINHKELKEMPEKQNVAMLPPKFLYKQYKNGINSQERDLLTDPEKDIKEIFEKKPIKVEKLDGYDYIEENITRFLHERQKIEDKENLYFFNLSGCDNLFDVQIPLNMELLNSFNKDKQLFLFVYSVDDYVTSYYDDRYQFWKFKKYYCFLTYFPISEIFDQLLIFAANLIKLQRSDSYLQYKLEQAQRQKTKKMKESLEQQYRQKIYQDIDAVNIIYKAKDEIANAIKLISDIQLNYDQPYIEFDLQSIIKDKNIRIQQEKLIYKLPVIPLQTPMQTTKENFKSNLTNQIMVKNRIRHTHIVMQIFSFDDFTTIFMEILKEGQILFMCENIYILTSVCYFFHLVIYPYLWVLPALYYSNSETIDNLLGNQMPFIAGLNEGYNKWIQNYKNKQQLQKSNLTIVEFLIKKEACGDNITPLIHQYQSQNNNLRLKKLKTNPYFQINEMLQKYKSIGHIFQISQNEEQSKKCAEFLINLINIIENDFIKKIVPDLDPDFISNGIWNQGLILKKMLAKIKDNEDQEFIKQYIFETDYFQQYLKHYYNFYKR